MAQPESVDHAPARASVLANIVVLELSSTPGATFAASLLADFNAQVYVCESPPGGSAMRDRPPAEWWSISARNKRSVALDASLDSAASAIQALLSYADVLITDVARIERADHPWLRHLDAMDSKPLVVDVIPPGADRPDLWPWSRSADLAAAATGMMALTGHAGETPVQPEFPLVDYLSGALAALRAVAELRRSKLADSEPADIVVPLHQAVQRMIEWQVPIATALGTPILRKGNSFPMSYSISNMHLTKDRQYIAISAANEATAAKLLNMLGGPELRDNPRYSTTLARQESMQEIYAVMDKWMAERTLAEVIDTATRHDVALGPIHDAIGIAADPHMRERGNIVRMPTPAGIALPMPEITPRIAGWDVSIRSLGPTLGEHTSEALARSGCSAETIQALRDAKVIWSDA